MLHKPTSTLISKFARGQRRGVRHWHLRRRQRLLPPVESREPAYEQLAGGRPWPMTPSPSACCSLPSNLEAATGCNKARHWSSIGAAGGAAWVERACEPAHRLYQPRSRCRAPHPAAGRAAANRHAQRALSCRGGPMPEQASRWYSGRPGMRASTTSRCATAKKGYASHIAWQINCWPATPRAGGAGRSMCARLTAVCRTW